ncbi:MAG: ABC transporter substrate-binding protein [Egibacteraceae bacterium]
MPITLLPDPVDELTRRRLLTGAGALGILIAFPASAWGQDAGWAAELGAFPVTIDHAYGSTEITEVPKRVVTVGLTDHDYVRALGVTPVGASEWYGGYPSGVWPWARDQLCAARPEIVNVAHELNFEAVAALEPDASTASRPKSAAPAAGPDLILGLYNALTAEQDDLLTQIAPTVAYPDYEIPWQEQARLTGHALRRDQRAEELVAEVAGLFAKAREEHPEFRGAPAGAGDEGLDAVDASGADGQDAIETHPVYQRLEVKDRDIFLLADEPVSAALAFEPALPPRSARADALHRSRRWTRPRR